MLAFAAAAFWEVWKSREGDLVEPRRKMRPRIIAVVGFYVVVIAFAEVAAHNEIADKSIIRIVGSTIILVVLAFCAALFQMRQADLFGPTAPLQKNNLPKAQPDDGLSEKLLAHMAREMAHRDETLSIAKLAQQLGEQEYRLRRTINQQLGHRNFTSFLNGYRLAEVKAALSDPTQKDVPIITIALDAGFGSLGPFNRAFREAEGMTPSAFRALKAG
jgi:AraC-like DNA-binding protein